MLIHGKALTGHDHHDVGALSEQFRRDIQDRRRENALARSSAPGAHRAAAAPEMGARRDSRKGTNRYKFQSISKLMGSTQIDLRSRPFQSSVALLPDDSRLAGGVRKRKQAHEDLDGAALASYFAQAIEYWKELDRSAGFRAFYQEVAPRSRNLLLVVHNKAFLAERLLARLAGPGVTSYKSFLDLLCLLALDLQDEFYYPHFGESLGVLARLIDSTPPQLAEQIFSTIIFLFKFCLRNLLTESRKTFQEFYVPLLAHSRDFVRRFSADTFAYLCRRVSKPEQLRDLVRFMTSREHLERLLEEPAAASLDDSRRQEQTTVAERFRDGLSHLLAGVVRGVRYHFHSGLPRLMAGLLDDICRAEDSEAQRRHRVLVVQGVLRRLCNYTRAGPEKADAVFDPLLARAQLWADRKQPAAAGEALAPAQADRCLQGLLSCVRLWVEFRHGSRITNLAPLLQLLRSLLLESPAQVLRSPVVAGEALELLLASWPLLVKRGRHQEALALLRGAAGLVTPENWTSVFHLVGRLVRLQERLEASKTPLEEEPEDEEDDSDAEEDEADPQSSGSAAAPPSKPASQKKAAPAPAASDAVQRMIQEQLARRQKKLGQAAASTAVSEASSGAASSVVAVSSSAAATEAWAAGVDAWDPQQPLAERMRFVVFANAEAALVGNTGSEAVEELLFSLLMQAHDPAPLNFGSSGSVHHHNHHTNATSSGQLDLPAAGAHSEDPDAPFDFQSLQARIHTGRWTEQHSSPVVLDPSEPALHPLQASLNMQPASDPEAAQIQVLAALRAGTPANPQTAGRYEALWMRDLRRRELGMAPRAPQLRALVVACAGRLRGLLKQLRGWSGSAAAQQPEQQQEVLSRLWVLARLFPLLGAQADTPVMELLADLRACLQQDLLEQAVAHPESPVLAPELVRDAVLVRSQLEISMALLLATSAGEAQLEHARALWDTQWASLRWHTLHWRLENSLPVGLPGDLQQSQKASQLPSTSTAQPNGDTAEALGYSVAQTAAVTQSQSGARRLWCVRSAGRPCAGCPFCGAQQPHQLTVPVLAAALATFQALRSLQARLLPKAVFRPPVEQQQQPQAEPSRSGKKKSASKGKADSKGKGDSAKAVVKKPLSLRLATARSESPLVRWLGEEAFTPASAEQLLELLAWSCGSQSQLARVLALDLLLLFPDPLVTEAVGPAAESADGAVAAALQPRRHPVPFYRDALQLMVRMAEIPAGMAHEPDIQRLLDSLRVLLPKFSRWNRSTLVAPGGASSPAGLVLNRLAPGLLLATLRLRCTSVWPAARACLLDIIAEGAETAAAASQLRRQQERGRRELKKQAQRDRRGSDDDDENENEDEDERKQQAEEDAAKATPFVGSWESFWRSLTLVMEQSRALSVLPATQANSGSMAEDELVLEPEDAEEAPEAQAGALVATGNAQSDAAAAQDADEDQSSESQDEQGAEADAEAKMTDDDLAQVEDEEKQPFEFRRAPGRAFPAFAQIGLKFQQWRWNWNSSADAHTFSDQLWLCLVAHDGDEVTANAGKRQAKQASNKEGGPSVWTRLSHALRHNQMGCVLELFLHFLHFEYEVVRPSQFGAVVGSAHEAKTRVARGSSSRMRDDGDNDDPAVDLAFPLNGSGAGAHEPDCCCPGVAVYTGGWGARSLLEQGDAALSVLGLGHLACQRRLPQLATHTHRYAHGHALAPGGRSLVQQRCLLMLKVLQRHFLRSPPSPPQYQTLQVQGKAAGQLLRGLDTGRSLVSQSQSKQQSPAFSAVSLLLPSLFRLLVSSDEALQLQTLECLACWRPDWLMPYMDRFRRLAAETTFRNEMTTFHLRPGYSLEDEAPIPEEFRPALSRVVIRLIYSKLVKRRTTKAKSTLKGRRAAIMAYLAGLQGSELLHLFEILLQPFTEQLSAAAQLPRLAPAEQQETKNHQLRQLHTLLGRFPATTVPPGLLCYDPRLSLSLLVGLTEADRELAGSLLGYRHQLGLTGGDRVEVVSPSAPGSKQRKQHKAAPGQTQAELLSWSPASALLTPQLSGLTPGGLEGLWANPYLPEVPPGQPEIAPKQAAATLELLRQALPQLSAAGLAVLARMLPVGPGGLNPRQLPVWASGLDFEIPVRVKLSFLHMQEHMVKQLRFVARDYFPTLLTLTLRLLLSATAFCTMADRLRKLGPEELQRLEQLQGLLAESGSLLVNPGETEGATADSPQLRELLELFRSSPAHRELFWELPLSEPGLMRALESHSAELAGYKQLRQLALRRAQALLACMSQFSDVLRQRRNRLGGDPDAGEALGPRYLGLLLYLLQNAQPGAPHQLGSLHVPGTPSYRALLELMLSLTEDPAYLQLLMYSSGSGADTGAASTLRQKQELHRQTLIAQARQRMADDAAEAEAQDGALVAPGASVADSKWLAELLGAHPERPAGLLCDAVFPSLFAAIEAPHLRTDGDGQGDRVALQVAERLLDVETASKGDLTLRQALDDCWRRHADQFVQQVAGRLQRLLSHAKAIAQNPAAFGVMSRHALAQETRFPGWELYLLAQASRYVDSGRVGCILLQSVLPLLSHKTLLAPHTTPFRTNMPAREHFDDVLSATLFKREAARQSLFQLISRLLPLLDGIGASKENQQHTGQPDSLQFRVAQQALEALSKQLLLLRPAYAAKSRVMLADCLQQLAELRGFRQFAPVMGLIVELNSQTRDGLDDIPDHTRRAAGYRRFLSPECLGSIRVSVAPVDSPQPEWVPALPEAEQPAQRPPTSKKASRKASATTTTTVAAAAQPAFWTESMLIPLCYQMLGELHHPELTARTQAAAALRQTLQVLGVVDRLARQRWRQMQAAEGSPAGDRHFFSKLLDTVVHAGLKRMLHGAEVGEDARREAAGAVAALYRSFKARFRAEQVLLGDASRPDQDFFAGIVDIQRHRRLKTMVRLRRLCERQLRAAMRGQDSLPANSAMPDDDGDERGAAADDHDWEMPDDEEDEDLSKQGQAGDGALVAGAGGDEDELRGQPIPLFSSNLVSGVLLPLVLNFLYQVPSGPADATQQALMDAASRAAGALSAHLSWGAWKSNMSQLVKQLAKPTAHGGGSASGGQQKWLVRTVCAILHEGFPVRALARLRREELSQQMAALAQAAKEDAAELLEHAPEDGGAEDDDDEAGDAGDAVVGSEAAVDATDEATAASTEAAVASVRPIGDPQSELPQFVVTHLQQRVLPQLYNLLKTKKGGGSRIQRSSSAAVGELEDGGHVFLVSKGKGGKQATKRDSAKQAALEVCERLPVAMAVVKVLLKLPELMFQRQFPELVLILIGYLKSKTQTLRDETRKVLVTLAMFVGPAHWPEIFRHLRQNLTRGYQRYVAVYTIFTLLRTIHERVLEHRRAFPVESPDSQLRQEHHQQQKQRLLLTSGGLFRDSGKHAEQTLFDDPDAPATEVAAAGASSGVAARDDDNDGDEDENDGSASGAMAADEDEHRELDPEMAAVLSAPGELELLLGTQMLHSGDATILREGCLDACLQELLPVLCIHLSPDARLERKQLARSTASTLLREAKRDCLPDSWYHLTATIGFREKVSALLSPLVEHLSLNCYTLKDVQHVSEILRRVGQGIQQNWSLTAADLLSFLDHALRVSLFGSVIEVRKGRVYARPNDEDNGFRPRSRGLQQPQDDIDWETGVSGGLDDDGDSSFRALNKIKSQRATGKQRAQASKLRVAQGDRRPEDDDPEEGEAEGERLMLCWPPEQYDPSRRRKSRAQGSSSAGAGSGSDSEDSGDEDGSESEDDDMLTDEELLYEDDDDPESQLGFEEGETVLLATQTGLTDAMAVAKAVKENRRAHLYKSRLGKSKAETFTIQKLPSSKPRVSRQIQANTLAEFVLGMLHTWLRKGSFSVPPEALAPLLDPMWPLLSRQCIGLAPSSAHSAAAIAAARAAREAPEDDAGGASEGTNKEKDAKEAKKETKKDSKKDPKDKKQQPPTPAKGKGKDAGPKSHTAKQPPVPSQRKAVSLSSTMTEVALRCLPFLIRVHRLLPSAAPRAAAQLSMLAAHCFYLLQSGHEAVQQSSFKTLAALLRYVPSFSLTPGRAKVLLSLAQLAVNSHSAREQAVGFTLLRAVVQRRITLPLVYDLALRLAEMMIKSQQETIQRQSAGIFLSFLLDYPLGEKRIREHFERLVRNFEYPRPQGRASLLRFLELLFVRLPTELLQQYSDLFFFPLVRNLVNDADRDCRRLSAQVLGLLLRSLGSPAIRDRYLERLYAWLSPALAQGQGQPESLSAQQLALQDCAVQVLGVFVEQFAPVDASFQQRHAPTIVRHLFRLLRGMVERQRLLQSTSRVQADDDLSLAQQQFDGMPGDAQAAGEDSDADSDSDRQSEADEGDQDEAEEDGAQDSEAAGKMEVSDEDASTSESEEAVEEAAQAAVAHLVQRRRSPAQPADPWNEEDSAEEEARRLASEEDWKLYYHVLIAVEKLAQHLPASLFTRAMCQRLDEDAAEAAEEPQDGGSGKAGKAGKKRRAGGEASQPSKKAKGSPGVVVSAANPAEEDFDTAWTGVCRLLLHPHSWIRTVASRIVGIYFAQQIQLDNVDASLRGSLLERGQGLLWKETSPVRPHTTLDRLLRESREQAASAAATAVGGKRKGPSAEDDDDEDVADDEAEDGEASRWQQHAVFQLARSFCRQLAVDAIDAQLADQIIKNLLFCLALMHRSSQLSSVRTYRSSAPPPNTPSLLQQKEREQQALPQQGKAAKRQKLSAASGPAAASASASASDQILDILGAKQRVFTHNASPAGLWVITRLSFLARQQSGGLFRKDCIFRLFSAAATVLDSADLRPYLLPMLHALYRIADSPPLNSSQAAADLKRLAQQTIDALRKNSAGEDFVAAYTHVRKVVTEIRAARKKQRRQAAVVDPARAASRRLAQSRRKKIRRSAQLQQHKHRRQFGTADPGVTDGSLVQRGVSTVLQR